MMTVRALLVAAVSVVALAAPASAGGPTSAILSVPGEGKTASLYYTDAEYEKLARLVGAYGVLSSTVDDSGATHESGPGVTVTWLIHDVEPWRIDRIYVNADGGPWIATQEMDFETGEIADSPVVWHQPASGKELSMLLDQLGVGQAARAASDFDGVAGAPVPAATEPETPAAAAPADDSDDSDDAVSGVWWGLGGVVAGAALALGFVHLRRNREDEPGLDPSADWLAPQTRST